MNSLCLKSGIHGVADSISASGGLEVHTYMPRVSAVSRSSTVDKPPPKKTLSFSNFGLKFPLKYLWPGGGGSKRYNGMALDDAVLLENKDSVKAIDQEDSEKEETESEGQSGRWVLKILDVRSLWSEGRGKNGGVAGQGKNGEENEEDDDSDEEAECGNCGVGYDDEEMDVGFDRESFSRLLRRVPLAEVRLYAQLSYLANLAYFVPKIERGKLLRKSGFRFITSSFEKKELAAKDERKHVSIESQEAEKKTNDDVERIEQNDTGRQMNASSAFDLAASAAAYLNTHTKTIIPYKPSRAKACEQCEDSPEEIASLMATTESVTAVVAAKEEVKQAVADNLNSTRSSPCEWFICDDEQSGTRIFVIQGSESLASWQANLLFEPVGFEGMDVLVHRGIYEAAKGIYEQMLPEVRVHLETHGDRSTFRFTGHSLGGSLALLVNLMLLIRHEVPARSLLPVITFGAPSIMCRGELLLRKLGLSRSHVQAITMHMDIVPRAFSCTYPSHVARLLKAINGKFRSHPCLNNQKLLYAPMGELLILQPDEKFSPNHHLLPSGSGLYQLICPLLDDARDADKQLWAAQTVFLNSPHPLEILSDRSAYGSDGMIQRDHDMNSYLRSLRWVIRQELNRIRKAKRENRRKVWWPIVTSDRHVGQPVAPGLPGRGQFNFSGISVTGQESLKRFSRLVASQHTHMLFVLLLPARLPLLGAFGMISFH